MDGRAESASEERRSVEEILMEWDCVDLMEGVQMVTRVYPCTTLVESLQLTARIQHWQQHHKLKKKAEKER